MSRGPQRAGLDAKAEPPAVVKTYLAALARGDADTIHDLVVRRGTEILERGVPYLLIAARWREQDRARRAAKDVPLAESGQPETLTSALLGPLDAAMADEGRRLVLNALCELQVIDGLAVWRWAEGWSDEDIASSLAHAGLVQDPPTVDSIRQRRRRALVRLRQLLEKATDPDGTRTGVTKGAARSF